MNKTPKELSWFKQFILQFLYESHSELTEASNMINAGADLAAETYFEAISNGLNQLEAEELAHKVLFKGLHFLKHDTLLLGQIYRCRDKEKM